MAKARNYHVRGSVEFINRLKEEYDWLGRYAKIETPGHLVVFALPPKKVKEKFEDKRRKPSNREDRKSG
jgi:hypothetical protein